MNYREGPRHVGRRLRQNRAVLWTADSLRRTPLPRVTMSTSDCVVETCVNEDRQVPERDRAASSNTTRVAEPPRGLVIAFVLLCLLGLGVSIELSRIHVFVHTDPSYHSVCAMSEGVNCETVAASPYSVFAGLPVAVWELWRCGLSREGFIRRGPGGSS